MQIRNAANEVFDEIGQMLTYNPLHLRCIKYSQKKRWTQVKNLIGRTTKLKEWRTTWMSSNLGRVQPSCACISKKRRYPAASVYLHWYVATTVHTLTTLQFIVAIVFGIAYFVFGPRGGN